MAMVTIDIGDDPLSFANAELLRKLKPGEPTETYLQDD